MGPIPAHFVWISSVPEYDSGLGTVRMVMPFGLCHCQCHAPFSSPWEQADFFYYGELKQPESLQSNALRMEEIQSLPSLSSLSPSTISFLNKQFHRKEDLIHASRLVSELQNRCRDLDRNLIDLNRTLETTLLAYVFHSNGLHDLFRNINLQLNRLCSTTCFSSGPLFFLSPCIGCFPPF